MPQNDATSDPVGAGRVRMQLTLSRLLEGCDAAGERARAAFQ